MQNVGACSRPHPKRIPCAYLAWQPIPLGLLLLWLTWTASAWGQTSDIGSAIPERIGPPATTPKPIPTPTTVPRTTPTSPNPPPTTQPTMPPATVPNRVGSPTGTSEDPLNLPGKGFGGVSVDSLDDLQSLVIEGPQEQVDALLKVIEQIDRLSLSNEPQIVVVPLQHARPGGIADLVTAVFQARTDARPQEAANRGTVAIVPVAQPRAVVVIAQEYEIKEIIELVNLLDSQTLAANTQFQVFPLKRANATQVATRITEFVQGGIQVVGAAGTEIRGRNAPHVEVFADTRTNAVIIFAAPAEMKQIAELIQKLDSGETESVIEMRIFQLQNSDATQLAQLLQQAIATRTGATEGATTTASPVANAAAGAFSGVIGGGSVQKSSKLRLVTTDGQGNPVESGILEDISVYADVRTNSLTVLAPPESMPLIAQLVAEFDQKLNSPAAQLKIFTLINSDASSLVTTLRDIFQSTQQGGTAGTGAAGGFAGGQTQTGIARPFSYAIGGESPGVSLVPLSFSVDSRTNSILAIGTEDDLIAVEALILKLDSNTARERRNFVYRLRNLAAEDAALALNNFLQSQASQGTGLAADIITLQQQLLSEIAVVPEPVSNTLLISSTPRYFDEVLRVVQEIDARQPQVVIQVMIAEVALSDNEEFGLELGGQSEILFDRSIAVENELIPGFNFNTVGPLRTPIGTDSSAEIGLQSLTNFALGRGSPTLGFGGLILTASSENLSVLLRALKRQGRLDVLSRPHITALDNREASINVGQLVPFIDGFVTTPQGGSQNNIVRQNVGVNLSVLPKISPDGTVIMQVRPEVSSLSDQGVAIGTDGSGSTIQSPIINQTVAETTVLAQDGQTIVLGGLIVNRKTSEDRKLPWVGDWPVIGWAFRTRFRAFTRSELLIILTPRIIVHPIQAQLVLQEESDRIDWILSDVEQIYGDIGLLPKAPPPPPPGFGPEASPKQKHKSRQNPNPNRYPMCADDHLTPTIIPGTPNQAYLEEEMMFPTPATSVPDEVTDYPLPEGVYPILPKQPPVAVPPGTESNWSANPPSRIESVPTPAGSFPAPPLGTGPSSPTPATPSLPMPMPSPMPSTNPAGNVAPPMPTQSSRYTPALPTQLPLGESLRAIHAVEMERQNSSPSATNSFPPRFRADEKSSNDRGQMWLVPPSRPVSAHHTAPGAETDFAELMVAPEPLPAASTAAPEANPPKKKRRFPWFGK